MAGDCQYLEYTEAAPGKYGRHCRERLALAGRRKLKYQPTPGDRASGGLRGEGAPVNWYITFEGPGIKPALLIFDREAETEMRIRHKRIWLGGNVR